MFKTQNICDMVSFARLYINNPDLAERIQNGWPLSQDVQPAYFYGGGHKGYTDYPTYNSK